MTSRGERRLLLHIGMHKTGSSSIQDSFQDFADGDTVRYAKIAPAPNHGYHLRAPFEQDVAPVYASLAPGAQSMHGTRILRAFLAELNSPTRDLIVSGEALSTFDHHAVSQLLDTVAASGREVHVLCYLRDPISLRGSLFQQDVKKKLWSNPWMPELRYREAMTPWLDLVPRDRLTIRDFSRVRTERGTIVADFCDWAGIEPALIVEKRTNAGLADGCVRLLWLLNRLHDQSPKTADHVAAHTHIHHRLRAAITGPGFSTPLACLRDTPELRETLDWLADTTGIDFHPEVDAAAPHMKGRSIADEMCRIDATTRAQLSDMLDRMKIFRHRRAPIETLVAEIYRSAVFRARWRRRRDRLFKRHPRSRHPLTGKQGFRRSHAPR